MADQEQVEQAAADALSVPKYPQPKILLMDVEPAVAEALKGAGYNVESGSFGAGVKVPAKSEYRRVPFAESAPNETEQEIIIIDNGPLSATERELPDPVEGELHFWQLANKGVLNPRPLSMVGHRHRSFDRILEHGGVFICFVDRKHEIDYLYAKEEFGQLEDQQSMPASTWGFLSLVEFVRTDGDFGQEISLTDLGEEIPGLKAALRDATFDCTFDVPEGFDAGGWGVLAQSKYGATVAAVMTQPDDGGVVFLLPRVKDKAKLVMRLVADFLPRIASKFYPHIRSSAWVKEAPYELPEVLKLEGEIAQVRATADTEVKKIEERIEAKRVERGFLYKLLTATDSELVTAVKQTLELIGFKEVKDLDEEVNDDALLREDLQIWDRKPILLVEVKGITGLPKEAYSLQVEKYVMPRAEEWGHFDVRGLTVINHQLGKVGLERDHDHVFQESVITTAKGRKFGLLTTWELFRLARGYLQLGWTHEQVAGLIYQHGVIKAVPSHYEVIGSVNQFFEPRAALSIDLSSPVVVGDRLAYELPIDFKEESVTSLQLNDASVEEAEAGQEVGVKTSLTKQQARKGVRVYRVLA